jgi:hypothetical protein
VSWDHGGLSLKLRPLKAARTASRSPRSPLRMQGFNRPAGVSSCRNRSTKARLRKIGRPPGGTPEAATDKWTSADALGLSKTPGPSPEYEVYDPTDDGLNDADDQRVFQVVAIRRSRPDPLSFF